MKERGPELTREGERYPSRAQDLAYLPGDPPAPGEGRRIADGLWWLRMPLPMELNHINLWLLEDGDSCTVVDTGLGAEECRAAWESLEAGDGRPWALRNARVRSSTSVGSIRRNAEEDSCACCDIQIPA